MKNIKLRQMKSEDIPEVMEIEKECLLSHWSFDAYQNELTRNDSKSIVAETSGESIVGFIVTRLIISDDESEVLNIAVSEEYRLKGVGAALLQGTIDYLTLNQIKSVFLEVRESNLKAQNFYLKNGFNFCGRRKNFYTNPAEDAMLMRLDL